MIGVLWNSGIHCQPRLVDAFVPPPVSGCAAPTIIASTRIAPTRPRFTSSSKPAIRLVGSTNVYTVPTQGASI